MTPVLTPEDELSLLLARGQLNPEERTRILQFLAIPLQWPLLLERAYSPQVYPPLYRNLRDLGFSGVPEAVPAELRGLYLANALRNQLLAEELARLLSLLGEAGIRVAPLKGVALAQSLYGDVAAWVCLDFDILVPPANVPQAIDLLLASGYRSEVNDPYFSKLRRPVADISMWFAKAGSFHSCWNCPGLWYSIPRRMVTLFGTFGPRPAPKPVSEHRRLL
jgi:putative nucleotidyltransferase-like protein